MGICGLPTSSQNFAKVEEIKMISQCAAISSNLGFQFRRLVLIDSQYGAICCHSLGRHHFLAFKVISVKKYILAKKKIAG